MTALATLADSPRKRREGASMQGCTIPTVCGRSVLIRDCFEGEVVQLAIIGKRGGMQEAVSFDAAHLLGLIGALSEAREGMEQADDAPATSLLDRLSEAEEAAALDATHCPNGHELTPESTYANPGGTRSCRECRRQRNVWQRKRDGLPALEAHEVPLKAWRFRPPEGWEGATA